MKLEKAQDVKNRENDHLCTDDVINATNNLKIHKRCDTALNKFPQNSETVIAIKLGCNSFQNQSHVYMKIAMENPLENCLLNQNFRENLTV